jgi:hypothetical protein
MIPVGRNINVDGQDEQARKNRIEDLKFQISDLKF